MDVIPKLASTVGRRDEVPNQRLAEFIAAKNDKKAIRELVQNLSNKDKAIQSDCVKVLYEIGVRKPKLISGYVSEFLDLLESKNNRLVWGAMTALDAIALENPAAIYKALPKIIAIADSGSVITRDHAVGILIKLLGRKTYMAKAFPLLLEQLRKCPTNQLPMYAENALPFINSKNKSLFAETLSSRIADLDKESKRKRIQKVLRSLN